jgi:uncharacterized protein (TIGR02266 family)
MSSRALHSERSDDLGRPPSRPGRSTVDIPVHLHGEDEPAHGVARNISPEGAFVATQRLVPVGTRLMLMLVFPGDRRPLAVRAEVRWTRSGSPTSEDPRPPGLGLRFLDPPLGVALSIADMVEKRRFG